MCCDCFLCCTRAPHTSRSRFARTHAHTPILWVVILHNRTPHLLLIPYRVSVLLLCLQYRKIWYGRKIASEVARGLDLAGSISRHGLNLKFLLPIWPYSLMIFQDWKLSVGLLMSFFFFVRSLDQRCLKFVLY